MAPCVRFPLDALPGDVFALLLSFFNKRDLLALSHVDGALFRDLLGPTSDMWQSRLPTPPFAGNAKWTALVRTKNKAKTLKALYQNTVEAFGRTRRHKPPSAKALYFTSLSLSFLGHAQDRAPHTGIPHKLRIPSRVFVARTRHSFSFDVWFVVTRGSYQSGGACGGPLLSSTHRFGQGHAFVAVNDGHLSSSMMDHGDNRLVVAQQLVTDRWYHLALSFDRRGYEDQRGEQRVYLDGELVHTTVGSLHPAWLASSTKRIGIGYDGEVGWINFNGVVDDFRLWTGVLSTNDVAAMQHGGESLPRAATYCWSLKQDGDVDLKHGRVTFVRCTRPREDRDYREEEDMLKWWRWRTFRPNWAY